MGSSHFGSRGRLHSSQRAALWALWATRISVPIRRMAFGSSSLPLQAVFLACSAVAALAQSVRGTVEKAAVQAAEYPMTTVPTNPNSTLAMASMLSAVLIPFAAIGVMLVLKEKAWWGACYLIGGLITLVWLYCAYIAL